MSRSGLQVNMDFKVEMFVCKDKEEYFCQDYGVIDMCLFTRISFVYPSISRHFGVLQSWLQVRWCYLSKLTRTCITTLAGRGT